MKIIVETSLENFEAWSGGKDTMNDLSHSDCERLDQHIEELYPDGITETQLNDFLWLERDTIADLLGYRSYEALMEQDDEGWEDHYRTILKEEHEDYEDYIEDWVTEESAENMSDKEVFYEFKEYLNDRLEEEKEEEDEEADNQ